MIPTELRGKVRRLEAAFGSGHDGPNYPISPPNGKELDGFVEIYVIEPDGKMKVVRSGEQIYGTK